MNALKSAIAVAAMAALVACGSGGSTIASDVMDAVDIAAVPDISPEVTFVDALPDLAPETLDDLSTDLYADLHLDWWEPTPGGAGWPCDDGDQCDSGLCIMTPDGKQCTVMCEEECPFGWQCVQHSASLPDTVFICTPVHMELCKPCQSNADCMANGADAGAACVSYGSAGNFCGAACSAEEANDCPAGYACNDVQDISGQWSGQCMLTIPGDEDPPSPPLCQCGQWFIDQQAQTACFVENEFGSCPGMRQCAAEGLTDCDGAVPAAEECNGADDDCDGEVDNDVVLVECFVQSPFGLCPGVEICVAGVLSCDGPEPKQELCDGEDNDCDGEVDENFEDTDNDGLADCLESDKDGDGIADGLDNCPSVFNPPQEDADFDLNGDACDPDDDNDQVPDDQDCAPLDKDAYPGAEELCDGIDNNCNAIADEGYDDTDADGWKDCIDEDDDGDGVPDLEDCQPLDKTVYPDAAEECNGIDDDCDETIDEDFSDLDQDGTADCVDDDLDGDSVDNNVDNCPAMANQEQDDLDLDGIGDACDNDLDGDSIPNGVDNCPLAKNTLQGDIDNDGLGDKCDDDPDGDDVIEGDNCPLVFNPTQEDLNGDGIGDACADDKDGDGVPDAQDCQPLNPDVFPGAEELCDGADNDCDLTEDEGFPDLDADGVKNCVDNDDDDDGDPDESDCAPLDPSIHAMAPEVCDGLDNNCDGKPDEGLGDLACGKGECFNTVPACVEGMTQSCDPLAGVAVEICDGLDNDCDGLVDEDLGETTCGVGPCLHTIPTCAEGGPTFCDPMEGAADEICDGLDNDCDGALDEELGVETCGLGLCQHTVALCVGGIPQQCDPMAGSKPESCDGLDNDCDSEVDQDLGQTTCGFGNCEHTVDNCVDGAPNICNPFTGAAPEECDNQDNDCDGLVDEDLGMLTCGLGICQHSVPACVAGEAGTCDPLQGADVESCGDGLDNNCDGVTDANCGAAGTGTCIGELCCDLPCDGTCTSCTLEGVEGTCTAYDAGTDPEEECGSFQCNGAAVEEPGFSACFVECTEELAMTQCKEGTHCDESLCVADLNPGEACDEDTDCQSGACRVDWDGDGMFCAVDESGCVWDQGEDGLALPPDGWVECAGGDGYRECDAGLWSPAAPEEAVACPAAVCDDGCGYVTDEDNECSSGQGIGVEGGCQVADLDIDFECVDCGHLTASPGACNEGVESCSKACGAGCEDGELDDPGVTYCFEDANGDLWKRLDGCYLDGDQCAFADDQADNDEQAEACGNFDCVNDDQCLTSCASAADCNDGLWCGPDSVCYDGDGLAPWEASGDYLVLTKDDDTYFNGSDCPNNFFGVNEATVNGVPFRVGPHKYGSQLAGLKANVEVPAPNQSWLVNAVHFIFPGGRCSSQPLKVTFMYADGSSGETGQASIPHDCSNGGNWSGSNYQIVGQGTYGGPCCDWWYYGKFTNPNPAKAVAKIKPYYSDGCGGSYDGQLWAATID